MKHTFEMLSQQKAAEFCNFSVSTLKRLREIGDFPIPIKLSLRRIAYHKTELQLWLENRSRKILGDLSKQSKKVRCPSTPLEVDQAYYRELSELKTSKGLNNGKKKK